MKPTAHGANLFELSRKYHFNPEEIKDFSSNINPFGMSEKALNFVKENLHNLSIYPDPAYTSLKASISRYCKAEPEHIILGEGATGLITGLIHCISPKQAMIIRPSYSEYETQLNKLSSCLIHSYTLKKEEEFKCNIEELIEQYLRSNSELLILCNPNNPTGSAFSAEEIARLASKIDSVILIDETYMEFTDIGHFSSTELTKSYPNLFVIRGTSKFFSTPGIRLGYAISSNQKIREYFQQRSDLWNINIIATMMGEHMFEDEEYIEEVYRKISHERSFLLESLRKFAELKVYPSYGNFILSEIVSKRITAYEVYEHLIKDAIAVRNCSSFATLDEYFFRVCTLSHRDNELLISKLKQLLN